LISRALVAAMRPGAALVDLSIDQGGCAETSRPTTHADPTYRVEGVVHYAVANMPGMVPHTATLALTNATLSYALAIADHGFADALRRDPALCRAFNVLAGHVTHPVEAEGDAAVRRRAEGERLEQEAEARLCLALRHAEEREHALLHVGAMDTDAAAAELDAVEHQVVGLRADGERGTLETVEILLGGCREGMVHGDV